MLKIKNYTNLFSTIVGIVFLISGFAKAIDSGYFANIILQYGVTVFQAAAPLIIFIELSLGLLLTFQIRVRLISLLSFIFIATLTTIYTYGLLFKKVKDCGCFGHISMLNTSPVFTYIRNAILLLLLFVCWRKGSNDAVINWKIISLFIPVTCIGMFMCGYTFKYSKQLKSSKKPAVKALSETALGNLITASPDSTYLVFVFSYTCPHCMNSIGNLEQYEKFGIADKIIGLAIRNDEAEAEFRQIFNPKFEIKNLSKNTALLITRNFPRSYYIKHDSVQFEIAGELPSAYFLIERARL